jgi:hypothetical protein
MINNAVFAGWPSGDCKPIVELTYSPDEIASKWGLQFKREQDDLDWYWGSHTKSPTIGPVVLMRHENTSSRGTLVYVDYKLDRAVAVKAIKELFQLDDLDIIWQSPPETF